MLFSCTSQFCLVVVSVLCVLFVVVTAEPVQFQGWKGGAAPFEAIHPKGSSEKKSGPEGPVVRSSTEAAPITSRVVHDEDNIVFIKKPASRIMHESVKRDKTDDVVFVKRPNESPTLAPVSAVPAPAPVTPPTYGSTNSAQLRKAKEHMSPFGVRDNLDPAQKNIYGMGFNSFDIRLWRYLFTNRTAWEGELSVYRPRSCRGKGPVVEYEFETCKHEDRDAWLTEVLQLPPITDEGTLIIALTHWCTDEMNAEINPSRTFFAAYGSVMDCVVMLNRQVKQVRSQNNFYVHELVNMLYPIVPIPEVSPTSNPRLANIVKKSQPACSVPFDDPSNWMNGIAAKAVSYYSQSTQDGVLIDILLNIKPTNSYYVEIGYNDDQWVSGSNCYALNKLFDWSGLLLDGKFNNPEINLHQHYVYPHNVLELFEKYGVPPNPDYISVDIDSQDLWLARKILSSPKYRPRIMSVEYNCHLPIGSTVTMPPGTATWNRVDSFYGTSAGAIKLMANEFDYEVVHFAGTMDMFLVQRELLGNLCPPSYASFANRVETLHACVEDPERKHKWIEYSTFMELVDAHLEMSVDPAVGASESSCRSEYDCTDPFILGTAQNAALEQYLLMTKVSENYASTASCAGFI